MRNRGKLALGMATGAMLLGLIGLVLTSAVSVSRHSSSEVKVVPQEQTEGAQKIRDVVVLPNNAMPDEPMPAFKLQVPGDLPARVAPDDSRVQRNIDTYFDGLSRKASSRFSDERFQEEAKRWRSFHDVLKTLTQAPEQFRGKQGSRGIVTSCGGRYFSLCLANIRVLTELHRTRLPIEVWYNGAELNGDQIRLLDQLRERTGSPRLRTFGEIGSAYNLWFGELLPGSTNVGRKDFQTKLMAIMGSAFQEVLFLDSDNTAARDPSPLFEMEEYKSTGALFWPDMYQLPESNQIWRVMGVPPRPMWAQESGQVLLNKERSWRPLMVAALLNQRQEFYYALVNGDKDTFVMSWLATSSPYHMVSFPPMPAGIMNGASFCGSSFVQSDPSGRPIFIHGVGIKTPPHSSLPRKWQAVMTFDPIRSAPIYRWQGACIDVAGDGTAAVPFSSLLGNIEDAVLFFLSH